MPARVSVTQDGPSFPITGIPVPPGQDLPARWEITEWYNLPENKYQVSLFMHALEVMKNKPVEELLSFFQIGGIHCFPLVSWDGAPAATEKINPSDPFEGYCNHNMVTFPTWHRPYMLLYEQAISAIMSDLVNNKWEIPSAELPDWQDAATKFRLPYWDWARKQEYIGNFGIPEVCTLETITVAMPGGQQATMENPLVRFQNPKRDADGNRIPMGDPAMKLNAIANDGDLPWSDCTGTSRYGILWSQAISEWTDGVNNWQGANAGVADPQWYGQGTGSFADAVNRMFSEGYFDSWETFASTVHNSPKTATNFMSLEFIHNVVHNATGGLYMYESQAEGGKGYQGLGLGHMSDVPVAAFDPIFYFHHCNIDRLTAIWQTLNSDMWFNNPQAGDPSSSAPLPPFHYDTNYNTYTSDQVRDWTTLHYQYDDLLVKPDARNPDGTVNREKYLADVRARVDELYPSTSKVVRANPGLNLGRGANDANFDDYIINVVYDRHALDGKAYAILFFVGDPPSDLSQYRSHENFVGQIYTFSAPAKSADGTAACGNCRDQKDNKVLSKAQVAITVPLLAKLARDSAPNAPGGGLPLGSLEPEPVGEVLRRGLNWEFVELGGRRRDKSEFPDTEIAVMHGTGRHPDPSRGLQLPRYRGYKKLTLATEHKMLGSGPAGLIRDDA